MKISNISRCLSPSRIFRFAVVLVSVALLSNADTVTTFVGMDDNVVFGSPLPGSNAANASFGAAAAPLGTPGLITFESAPLGEFTTLGLGSGVTLTLLNASQTGADGGGIINDTVNPGLGFNTTPGGAKFVRFTSQGINVGQTTTATATFSFLSPIDAFGAYLTGLGGGGDTVTLRFNDGVARSYQVPDQVSMSGESAFFGFTDPGVHISSVAIQDVFANSTRDGLHYYIGIDDVRFSSVPEPHAVALLLFSLVVGVSIRRRNIHF
jgi:hypothetical protein